MFQPLKAHAFQNIILQKEQTSDTQRDETNIK